MALSDTDLFVVNRNNNSYKVTKQNLMAELQDDDLLLVGRGGISYKITGAEFKGSMSSQPIIDTVTLTEDDPAGARFTNQDFTTTVTMLDNGNPASVKSIRGKVKGELSETVTPESDEIVDVDEPPTEYQIKSGVSDLTWDTAGAVEETVQFGNKPSITGNTKNLYYNCFKPITSINMVRYSGDSSDPSFVYYLYGSNSPTGPWTLLMGPVDSINGSGSTTYPLITNGTTPYQYFWLQRDDGQSMNKGNYGIDDTFSPTPVLTFATDKDLAKFEAGDAVRQENSVDGGTIYSLELSNCSNPEKAFDGTDSSPAVSPNKQSWIWKPTGLPPMTSLQIISGTGGAQNSGNIYLNNLDTGVTNNGAKAERDLTSFITDRGITQLDRLEIQNNNATEPVSLFQVIYNGTILVDGTGFSPRGTVGSVDVAAKTMTLATSIGTWGPANADHYVIGPTKTITEVTDKYLNLNADLQVIGLTDDDSYTAIPGNTPADANFTAQIKFPSILDSGEAPDDALPEGTTIQTEVKAENSAGADTMESNELTPISSDGPNATMHGLRFDSDRLTTMVFPKGNVSNDYTLSFWIKPTNGSSTERIFQDDQGSSSFSVYYSSGSVTFGTGSSFASGTVPTNQWSHCVASYDGSVASLSVNGGAAATKTVSIPWTSRLLRISGNSTEGVIFNGYLSDVYFVDGQALEPTVFGYDYENQGKWAPLDSAVIKQNIADAGGFGTNGFYLPFDPTATGKIWSDKLTVKGSDPTFAFDGNLSTRGRGIRTSSNGQTGWELTTSFSNVNSLRIYMVMGSQRETIVLNGTTSYFQNNGASGAWINVPSSDLATIGNTISSIAITANSGATVSIYGVEVNGKILVDHNSIGVDDSGNGNDFQDENFAVGTTTYYSKTFVSTTGFRTGEEGFNAFDGGDAVSTTRAKSTGNGQIEWDTSSFNLVGTLEVRSINTRNVIVDGVLYDPGLMDAAGEWKPITTISNPSQIIFTGNDGTLSDPGIDGAAVYGIKVDGVLLIDANLQDTVTDTPVKNYAVLNEGTNGNLVANSATSITYLGEVGTDYYYEEDGVGKVHTGGQTFASVSGKTYNFGQQPFVNTGDWYDDSQVWSSYLSTNTSFDNSPANAFDGIIGGVGFNADWGAKSSGVSTITFTGVSVSVSSSLVVYVYGDNTNEISAAYFQLNGSSASVAIEKVSGVTNAGIRKCTFNASYPLTLSSLSYSNPDSGKSTMLTAIEVDGRILVDTGSPLVAAYGNTLFQTWTQWNNVSLMLATNPAHVARFNTIKAAMESYEGDKEEFREDVQQLLISVVASGALSNNQEETLAKLIQINN